MFQYLWNPAGAITMYGKAFSAMYEGSMIGAGPVVYAVWGYCISKADPDDHTVLLNPVLLATIIGTSQAEIESAIEYLASPDPKSKCPDHEGRRILNQGGHLWFLVTHARYRDIKNNCDRRAYMRNYMRVKRKGDQPEPQVIDPVNPKVNESLQELTPASVSVSASGKEEGDARGSGETTGWTVEHVVETGKKATVYVPEKVCRAYFDMRNSAGWVDSQGRRKARTQSELESDLRHFNVQLFPNMQADARRKNAIKPSRHEDGLEKTRKAIEAATN